MKRAKKSNDVRIRPAALRRWVLAGTIATTATGAELLHPFSLKQILAGSAKRGGAVERRARLDNLGIAGRRVQVPPFFTDVTGERMLDLAREHGLEGVVAKRVDSPLPGCSPLAGHAELHADWIG